jgi:hypothetical protein
MKAPAAPGCRAIIGEPCDRKIEGRVMHRLEHPRRGMSFDAVVCSVRVKVAR